MTTESLELVVDFSADAATVAGSARLKSPGPVRRSAGSDAGLVSLKSGDVERTLKWGKSWHLGSAAYWIARCEEAVGPDHRHAFGETLAEEVAACILGGHGVPAQIGLEAFAHLRRQGYLEPSAHPSGAELESALRMPLSVGTRSVHYRFAAQRGHRLALALQMLAAEPAPSEPQSLRNWLLQLPGVGLKTASWVVRNHLGSDAVAIIDIHVLRAGVIAGVFDPSWTAAKDYLLLEDLFLSWAALGGVSAAALDAVVWADMASLGRSAHVALGVRPDGGSWYALQAGG